MGNELIVVTNGCVGFKPKFSVENGSIETNAPAKEKYVSRLMAEARPDVTAAVRCAPEALAEERNARVRFELLV